MTELQRNMIEQERNMAKQIKDFLDKGIPKADIAKTTKFSLEYMIAFLKNTPPKHLKKTKIQIYKVNLIFLNNKFKSYKKNLTTRNLKMYN